MGSGDAEMFPSQREDTGANGEHIGYQDQSATKNSSNAMSYAK